MPETPRWWRPGLLLVAATALAVRVAFTLVLAPDLPPPGDAELYRTTAHHVASGDGFLYPAPGGGPPQPSAEHPPLFPLVLAALDLMGADGVRAQGVALSLLSGAGAVLVARLGCRVAGPVAGVVAGAVAAVHPMWLQPAGLVLSESLHLVLVPLVLLAALDLRERRTSTSALWLGLTIGAAALNRPEALGLLVVVAAPAALLGGGLRHVAGWRTLAVATAVALAVIAPWVIRNRVDVDGWALSTNGGKTLLGSNCPQTYGGPGLGGFSYDCQFGAAAVLVVDGPPEGEWWNSRAFDDALGDLGRQFIEDHPGEVPKVVAARVARMWGLWFEADQRRFDVQEGRHAGLQHAGQWLHLALLAAAVAGALRLLRARADRPAAALLLGPVALVTLTCTLIYGGTRMRAGAEPSLAVLAAVAVVAIAGRAPSRR
jgi:hypothetical protein